MPESHHVPRRKAYEKKSCAQEISMKMSGPSGFEIFEKCMCSFGTVLDVHNPFNHPGRIGRLKGSESRMLNLTRERISTQIGNFAPIYYASRK